MLASIFWDTHEIIFKNYLEDGKIDAGQYYVILLARLNDEIRKKRSPIKKNYDRDNAHI